MTDLRRTIQDAIESCRTEQERQAVNGILIDALRTIESPGDVVWRMMMEVSKSSAVDRMLTQTATSVRRCQDCC